MLVDQHIAIFENVLPKEMCDFYTTYFDTAKGLNKTLTRAQMGDSTKAYKDDETLFALEDWDLLLKKGNGKGIEVAMNVLAECYKEYADTYAALHEAEPHSVYSMRLQKTLVGGGYHHWHFENSSRLNSNRVAVFMFYLNDVEEGGETEFLYLHKRVKPKAGTLLIWPSSYTHTHRGNPPLSNDKYILTGWFEF